MKGKMVAVTTTKAETSNINTSTQSGHFVVFPMYLKVGIPKDNLWQRTLISCLKVAWLLLSLAHYLQTIVCRGLSQRMQYHMQRHEIKNAV